MDELQSQVKILTDHFEELKVSHRDLAGSVRTLTDALTVNSAATKLLSEAIVGTTQRPGLGEQVRNNTTDISSIRADVLGMKTRSWAIVLLAVSGFFTTLWKWMFEKHT